MTSNFADSSLLWTLQHSSEHSSESDDRASRSDLSNWLLSTFVVVIFRFTCCKYIQSLPKYIFIVDWTLLKWNTHIIQTSITTIFTFRGRATSILSMSFQTFKYKIYTKRLRHYELSTFGQRTPLIRGYRFFLNVLPHYNVAFFIFNK